MVAERSVLVFTSVLFGDADPFGMRAQKSLRSSSEAVAHQIKQTREAAVKRAREGPVERSEVRMLT